jgi:carboxymethylenebutenolidase
MMAAAAGLFGGALLAALSPRLIPLAAATRPSGEAPPADETPLPSLTRPTEGLSTMELGERTIDHIFARPEGEGTWPGIVLLHDGWGLRDEAKAFARRLAEEGFVVIAPDLNRGKVAKEADKARELSMLMDKTEAIAIATALGEHMKVQSYTGDRRVGIVGIDSGGLLALRTSMQSSDFAAIVSIYGRPVDDGEDIRKIGAPLLGIYGRADQVIPPADVLRLRETLEAGNRTAEIKIYDGAGHGFMDESSKGYDRAAAADAWSLMVSFLRSHL